MPKIRTHRHYRPRHQLTSMVIYVEFCDVLMNVEVFDLYPGMCRHEGAGWCAPSHFLKIDLFALQVLL